MTFPTISPTNMVVHWTTISNRIYANLAVIHPTFLAGIGGAIKWLLTVMVSANPWPGPEKTDHHPPIRENGLLAGTSRAHSQAKRAHFGTGIKETKVT